jgi:hypothetical protein
METILKALTSIPFLGAILTPAIQLWVSLLVLVFHAVVDAEVRQGTGNGPAKKLAAATKIDSLIAEPGSIDWPSFVPVGVRVPIVSGLIDLVVFALNKAGFGDGSKA